jgi:hypothetical protein
MDRFVVLAHANYETVCRFIVGLLDEQLALYNQRLPPEVVVAVECKLSWLVQLCASTIGPSSSDIHKNEDIICDGELCRYDRVHIYAQNHMFIYVHMYIQV